MQSVQKVFDMPSRKLFEDAQKAAREALNAAVRRQVAAATLAAEGEFATLKDMQPVQKVLDMPSRKLFEDAQKAARKALNTAVRREVAAATLAAEGEFALLSNKSLVVPGAGGGGRMGGGGTGGAPNPADFDAAGRGAKLLTRDLNDMHSAARGVASGFNAMWLTWGNLGPLLAGAALSNGFVQAVRKGSEFMQTLTAIEALAGESADAVQRIGDEALRIGRDGPFGPLQVAGAFKTLALAGLDAKEQLEAISAVKNFAIVGEVDINKAAEDVVAIATAYGYQAQEFSIVADMVTKTASSSMASVTDMSEAFKQASVVAQQYKVSLDDTSTAIALLSQVGIRGSAAGTSVRNMYTELMGTSKKARQVLNETIGVKVWDESAKSMKQLPKILEEMTGKLSKMTTEAQTRVIQELGNERGSKALSALLEAVQKKAQDTGESMATVFSKMQREISKSAGYAAQAAAIMGTTTQNQIKSVGTALESSLISAFKKAEPAIQTVAAQLRSAFGSEEFVSLITSLTVKVGELSAFLVRNADVLVNLAKGYLVYKTAVLSAQLATVAFGRAQMVWGAATAVAAAAQQAVRGLTVAFAGQATVAAGLRAAVGAGGLSTALGMVGPAAQGAATGLRAMMVSLGPIAIALAAGAAAWSLFSDATANSGSISTKTRETLDANRESLMNGIESEIDRLEKKAAAESQGLTGAVLAASVEQQLAKGRIENLRKEQLELLQVEEANLRASASRKKAWLGWIPGMSDDIDVGLQSSLKELSGRRDAVNTTARLDSMMVDKLMELAEADAVRVAKRLREESANRPSGTTGFDPDAKAGSSSDAASLRSRETQELEKRYATNLKRVEDFANSRKQILDAARSAEAISQGTFAAQELDLIQATEMEKLAVINSSGQMVLDAFDRQRADLQGKLASAKDPKDKSNAAQALKNLDEARETFVNRLDADKDAVENSVFVRLQKVALQTQGEIRKLNIEARNFAEQEAQRAADRRSDAEFEKSLAGLPDFTVAVLRAEQEEKRKILAVDRERTKAVEDQQRLIADFEAASKDSYEYLLNGDKLGPEALKTLEEMNKVLAERIRLRDQLREGAAGQIGAAGQDAAGVELSKLGDFDLASAFDAANVSVNGLNISLGGTLNAMMSLTKQQELYEKARAGAKGDSKALAKVELDNIKAQIKGTGDLLGATKGFFKEKTGAYKALDAAEKAYRVASIALAAQDFAQKMGWITAETALKVTSEGIKTGAEVTGTTTSLALTGQRTAAKAVEALVAQLTLPFPANIPAFAMVAAMLAGLGVAVGGMGGSGGTKVDPGNLGKGTVLGDPDATSESLTRSLELLESLESLSRVQITYTKMMAENLGSLIDRIGGVAGLVTRNGSTTSAYNGVSQGKTLTSLGKIAEIGAGPTALLGAAGGFALGSSVTLIGSVLGPLGALAGFVLAPIIGKLIGNLFNTKVKVTGSGLYAGAQDLGSILNGGLDLVGYADINKKKKAFGVTYSDKNSTKFSEIDPETRKQFSLVLQGLAATVSTAGGNLMGGNTEAAQKILEGYVVKLGKINLKGLSGEEVQKRLMDIFSAEGDKMAKFLLPAIADLQAVGEGALETLVRYSSTLAAVNDTLEIMGNQMFAMSLDGAKLAVSLADAFGGIEKYSSSMAAYYENYYSESERNAKTTERLTAALKGLGFALPATMADYRKMVDDYVAGGGLLTESGQSVYAELIALSEPFADLSESVRDAKEAVIDAAKGIMEYVNELKGNRGGLATPLQQLQAARSNYVSDLTLAKGGDAEAMARLTSRADEYISAQKEVTASSATTQAVIDQIIAELTQVASGVPAFAKGGMHAGGWALVGEQGPELAYFSAPARIYDANTSASMIGGADAELVQEVRALREEVRGLRAQQAQETAVIVNSNLAAQEQAANVVVQGVSEASERAAWVQQTQPVIK